MNSRRRVNSDVGRMAMNRTLPIPIMIALALTATSCASLDSKLAGCGNDVVREVRAPNGRMKAVVFERDCGSTTGFSTQISLLSSNKSLPNEIGNIFVATTDGGRFPGATWGGPDVDVSWVDDTHLLLRYDNRASVFKREESLANVNVRYETYAP
jgi:hypothetical protein